MLLAISTMALLRYIRRSYLLGYLNYSHNIKSAYKNLFQQIQEGQMNNTDQDNEQINDDLNLDEIENHEIVNNNHDLDRIDNAEHINDTLHLDGIENDEQINDDLSLDKIEIDIEKIIDAVAAENITNNNDSEIEPKTAPTIIIVDSDGNNREGSTIAQIQLPSKKNNQRSTSRCCIDSHKTST